MNERIRELDEAAKYSAIMALPTGQSGNELFVAKFAELIVDNDDAVLYNDEQGQRLDHSPATLGIKEE